MYVEEFLHFWDKRHLIRVYDEEQLRGEAAGHWVGLASMHHRSRALSSAFCRDQVLGTSVQSEIPISEPTSAKKQLFLLQCLPSALY